MVTEFSNSDGEKTKSRGAERDEANYAMLLKNRFYTAMNEQKQEFREKNTYHEISRT